jgi:flagellar hook-associated protein 2
MAGISSLGVGSGIDIRSLVDQLVAAERQPVASRLNRREAQYQAQLSAFGALKSALNEFRSSADGLSDASAFRVMEASSSNSDAVAVTASAGADASRYDIEVQNLAAAQSLASGAYASDTTVIGGGTLTFRFGTVTTDAAGDVSEFTQNAERGVATVEIDANASLAAIRDAVNEADIGVRASILNDGSGERLVFSAEDSGAANGFVVDVNADAGSSLGDLAFNATTSNLTRTRAGEDAALVVDGLAITRSGNEISDLIDGVTLSLKETTETAASIQISQDTAAVRGKIESFVESFNTLQQQISQIAGYDAEAEVGGILQGDAAVRNIQTTLRRLTTTPVDVLDDRAVRSLADLGITTTRDGTLEIDAEELDEALANSFDEVGALFGVTGLVDGDGFRYESSRSATQPGTYDVSVSALATRASIVGSVALNPSAASPVTIAEGNELQFSIDGTSTAVLSLTAGSYESRDALAAEIQARINGDEALREAGIEVSVGFDAGGALTLTSSRYGSESSVELLQIDATTAAELGLAAGSRDEGSDVAGTINGAAAEGFGRYLTAQSGDAEGLELEITGEVTGDLGSVTFSRGITERLVEALDGYLGDDGLLAASTDGLEAQIEDIADERQDLARRIEQIEARYVAQFTQMDILVAQLNQTSGFLSRQLSGLEALASRAGGSE